MNSPNKKAQWYRERLPALHDSVNAPELILLHGWANTSEIWRPWLPLLRRRANVTLLDLPGFGRSPFQSDLGVDDLLAQLSEYVPEKSALLGWSLGGMLAAEFTARYPQRCAALLTIATNACYVARPDWPHAQLPEKFEKFRASIASDAENHVRRFQGLQFFGDDRERELLRFFRGVKQQIATPEALLWGLDLLGGLDIRAALKASHIPGLHIFGISDALVPIAAADDVASLVPQHWVTGLAGAAHLPFFSQPELCWQHLDRVMFEARLLKRLRPAARTKQAVALSFSRAASTYDAVADLQRHVASRLQTHLQEPIDGELLDLGCGTGAVTQQLAINRKIIALDFAEGMVRHAFEKNKKANIQWLCGDAENLPLAANSVGGIFSSLAVQWCENLAAVFAEMARVLKPGARASIATLGPNTLHEMRSAWAAVDQHVHVNPFLDRVEIEAAINSSGLLVTSWDEEVITLEYAELRELTRELKALGAHNVNSGRPAGLTGRERVRAFSSAYEALRNGSGKLPATYQVWYLHLENKIMSDGNG